MRLARLVGFVNLFSDLLVLKLNLQMINFLTFDYDLQI